LAAPGHGWRRVKLEDYLTAAGNAGLYRTVTDRPPQAFTDIASGIRGTTVDPNTTPQGRTLDESLEQLRIAWGQVGAVWAQVRLEAGEALSAVGRAMRVAAETQEQLRNSTVKNQPCTAVPDDVRRRECYVWSTHEHPDLPGVCLETCMRCGQPNWEALARLLLQPTDKENPE
jgi:hypothetical protein